MQPDAVDGDDGSGLLMLLLVPGAVKLAADERRFTKFCSNSAVIIATCAGRVNTSGILITDRCQIYVTSTRCPA